jgi:hypothetical protein
MCPGQAPSGGRATGAHPESRNTERQDVRKQFWHNLA